MNSPLSRRDVIKTLLVTSACSLIENKLWAGKVVSEVAHDPIDPNVGVARITLSSFPALNANGGSVRLGSSNIKSDQSSPVGLYYPILINRISATEYVVLDSSCSHSGYVVPPSVGGPNGRITCPGHGSQYDIRGKVQPGFDAKQDLFSYPVSLASGILTIQLLDYGFNITQKSVLNESQKRLELSFPAFQGTEYEVRYRPNAAAMPSVVSFSKTINGSVNQTSLTGDGVNFEPKVYVLPQDGIYQVAIRLRTI